MFLPLLLGWSLCTQAAPLLQPLIDRTPVGTTLQLPPGRYAGPVVISRPMTLDGGGNATIQGNGRGTVVTIEGSDVVLRGLTIVGSGELHDSIDAGIQLSGNGHRIEDTRIEDVLFGIHLRQTTNVTVSRNRIVGKPLSLALRGDAIRVWNGTDNLVEGNDFRRLRDITFINAQGNRITGNTFTDGRYGLHAVFSPRLVIERNRFSRMETGITILYSRDVELRGNHVEHALGGGAGIVFKESDTALVEGNSIVHCAIGLKVDAPPEPVGVLTVKDNRFAHNFIGLFFYGEAGGHRFLANRFDNNLTSVAISAPGAGAANQWQGNRWDDYQGFDRNGDGIGDTPHEVWLHADRIWMETPPAAFFHNAPSFELLDFLERLAPFSAPYRVLVDPVPNVRP